MISLWSNWGVFYDKLLFVPPAHIGILDSHSEWFVTQVEVQYDDDGGRSTQTLSLLLGFYGF